MDKGGEADAAEAGEPGSLDPVEIALEASRSDPAQDSPAHRVLRKHERLIEAQTAQLGRQRWRDFIITALGVCVLGAGALLVWDASQADGVVVEPFAVPADLAERGLTGPVVATQLLDKLTTMQAETVSLRAASTYANDWEGDIAVEIPSTGVSVGELRRYLRRWLGRETRLTGEVFRTAEGRLVVTTRVGASPAARAEGEEAELNTLLQAGAEAIFAETQPYRYAVWLGRQGRRDEGDEVRRALVAGGDEYDRLWGYTGLASSATTLEEEERMYAAALRLRPDFAPALFNRAVTAEGYGQEERAYRDYGAILRHAGAARRQVTRERVEALLFDARTGLAIAERDMAGAAELSARRMAMPGAEVSNAGLLTVQLFAMAHDLEGARRTMEEAGLTSPEAQAQMLQEMGPFAEFDAAFALAVDDWAAARDRLTRVLAELADQDLDPLVIDQTIPSRAGLAYAQARLGQFAEARATIAPTRLNCAYCVRTRGLIEAYAGNPRGADHWLGEAVRIAPSLPAAHHDWAEAYLVRRDPERAIEQLRLAVRKGPRWAEPRKLWGDALMMQGRPAQAARKYREALRLAPGWGALHLAMGRAQAAAGRNAEALESFRAAARLDLNAADRAAVQRLTDSRRS